MILGIGIDIVEIGRIKQALSQTGFVQRVFTQAEREYCEARGAQRSASYAARFAGKEAVMKALGTGLSKGRWQEVEITVNELGQPEVQLRGYFALRAKDLQATHTYISLSHAREYAVAQAILEGSVHENSNSAANAGN